MKTKHLLLGALVLCILISCNNKSKEPDSSKAPENSHSVGTVTDICGNIYNVIKIEEMYLLAENMRCNKYDTQSELAGVTLTDSHAKESYNPYYTNASNKDLWDETYNYTKNISSDQAIYLGYLYNWAAAVGLSSEEESLKQVSDFKNARQGICPNGWHIPTSDEWLSLVGSIAILEKTKDTSKLFKVLKTKCGWIDDDEYPGLDSYGFSALPAGGVNYDRIMQIGFTTFYWSSTPLPAPSINGAYSCSLWSDGKDVHYEWPVDKGLAFSVRCFKN